jgi:hypothetical protein
VAQTPKYDLETVQAVCLSGSLDKIWFSAPSRSLYEVIRIYAKTSEPKSLDEATKFILEGLLKLTTNDFVGITSQWETVTDVYGLMYDGRPWYIKFALEDDGSLQEISFHPPSKELETISGNTIPKGDVDDKT